MTFDPYKLIKYHLYLLQLENYELGRFWKLLFARGWFPPKEQRKNLVWTKKALALFILSQIIILALAGVGLGYFFNYPFAFFWQHVLLFLALVYILDFFTPIILSVALIILWPVDWLVKKIVVGRARAKIRFLSADLDPGYFSRLDNGKDVKNSGMAQTGGLKIIGIAGSYGKTTMKEVLREVLSAKFQVLSTPESVNTPVGIARWILGKLDDSTQVIIVEMGEHYRGDVKELCRLAPPDIAVVCGINEAHMERMKNLDTIVCTIFEVVSGSKPKSLVVLNGDDELVMGHYKEFVWPDHRVAEYKVESKKYKVFNTERLVWEAEFEGIGKVDINLLGEYALGDVDAAIKIGESLGMSTEDIKTGIAKIKPIDHRLQAVKGAGNVLIIDDAYNGNPAGVAEAIKVLSRFTDRRKIYITPGLVEMGKATADVHRAIGKQLAGVADVVVLIKNSVTPFIEEGINTTPSAGAATPPQRGGEAPQQTSDAPRSSPPIIGGVPRAAGGGGKVQIIWFDTAQEAHSSLGKILKPNDVVLFQNDWGDQYI